MNSTVTSICDWYWLYCHVVLSLYRILSRRSCQVMPNHPLAVVPPPQEAALTPVPPPTRDTVIRWGLRVLQLGNRGHAGTHLPTELNEMIVSMTHGQEHRDRMASVFAEMNALPKCEACGSVSKPFLIFPFFPSPRPTVLFFSFSTNIICATAAICGSGVT